MRSGEEYGKCRDEKESDGEMLERDGESESVAVNFVNLAKRNH